MPVIFGQVGAPSTTSAADGSNLALLQGQQGELIASELHGKYYIQNKRGNLYFASTAAAGVTLSIFSNASYTGLALWNPQGSGKNLSIARTNWGQSTAATTGGTLGYSWLVNAGAALGTAAPLSAISTTGVIRGTCVCAAPSIGNSVVQNAVISATLTTAMTWGRAASVTSLTGATTTVAGLNLYEDLDGTMIVPPGVFWAMTASTATAATGWALSAIWEELPL